MEALLLKQIYSVSVFSLSFSTATTYSGQFINGPLAKEHGLEAAESDKPILEEEDLLEVLRYH